jgi:alkylation response protein AidB-like acyl-CoA dehydrogenase
MRFQLSPEQRDFAASLREMLAAAEVPTAVRAWGAGDFGPGRKLWARLADLGLTSLGHADSGADAVDLVLAFEELGRAAVPGPYVESVAVLPLLTAIDPESPATVAAPPHVPFALDAAGADAVYLLDGTTLMTAEPGDPVASVDAARRLSTVTARAEVAVDVPVAAALDRGALMTAAQIHGAAVALLHRSTGYALARKQFGRPIGSFQAIKHQLADAHVGLELARPLLFGAALALDSASAARDVSAAKVACTDAAYRAARTALQVHGAIGYTAEYDLALWLTKVRALVSAWGTQRFHRDRVLAGIRAVGR